MNEKLKKILKKPFVQSVIIMATGTIGAQIIKMILSPIVTRVYGPEAFGVMGIFMSIVQILIPITALTYPMAVVLPRDDSDAKGLIKLSIYISTMMAFFTIIILFLFKESIINIFNIKQVSSFLYLIPIVIILTTLMQVSEQWFIRTKQFRINAKVTFYQAVIIESSKIGIGLISPTSSVLVILVVISNGLKALLLTIFGMKSNYKSPKSSDQNRKSLISLAKKHKDFPLLRAPQMFIDATTQGLPVLLLTSLFNPIAAGYFTLCRTVLTLPSSFIGKAVGDVFYPRINSAALNKENLTTLITKAVLTLGGIGIVPFGILIIFGPFLFGFIFGDNWITAGEYARWIALSSYFRFINEPCLRALPVLSAQSLHLMITVAQTVIRIIALWFGFFVFGDDIVAIALYGITGGLINLLLIIITLKRSKSFTRKF